MKLVALLVVMLGAGAGAYFLMQGPLSPEHKVCARFTDLCGASAMTPDKCVEVVRDFKKASGPAEIDKLAACTAGANSCPGALGCLTGSGIRTATGVAGDFLKGLGDSLKQ